MNFGRSRNRFILCFLFCILGIARPLPTRADGPRLPPEAVRAIDKIYAGDTQGAITILRTIQVLQPENPVGYLLEAEAEWWQIYCDNSEVKYGMVDAWKRGKKEEDEKYLALVDKAIDMANAQIRKSDTAEMHLYAGNGFALKARMYALRGEYRAVAHAGVAARSEFLHALEIDPQMADATAGLGLYNYYVDSLSSAVKVLRFFMGIPGGDRSEGIRQMEVGIERGVLSQVTMRFYLAKNLRTFDREYERALSVGEPLGTRFPQNAMFQLLLGNLNAELGRTEKASEHFRAAEQVSSANHADCPTCLTCKSHIREIADSFLGNRR